MGRQLPVVLDAPDEAALVQYLRSLGALRIFEAFAQSPDELWVDELPPAGPGHLFFTMWPTNFPWAPKYQRATTGAYYVANGSRAPVIEYSRPPLSGTEPGRLYWASGFSGSPEYDAEEFRKLVDTLWGWVRRTARRAALPVGYTAWVFPAARQRIAA